MKEEITLTITEFLQAIQSLPKITNYNYLFDKHADVIIAVMRESKNFARISDAITPIDKPLIINLRFRINPSSKFFPFWEPVQRIIIDSDE